MSFLYPCSIIYVKLLQIRYYIHTNNEIPPPHFQQSDVTHLLDSVCQSHVDEKSSQPFFFSRPQTSH